ncbi:MAG: DUF4185 domain-containing protein, partial [Gammaproteobacteria bacterium]|nr:DUF4185 domain-containing protein [Gammaproteobacteria bacterium]
QSESLNFGSSRHIGAIKKPDSVSSLQGGITLEFNNRILWVFGETRLNETNSDGYSTLSNSAAWSSDKPIDNHTELNFVTNDMFELTQFIEYNNEERQLNAENTETILILPLGGFVKNEIGYIYYSKQIINPVYLSQTYLGVGIARVESNGDVTRLSPDPVRYDDPTLFWEMPEYKWGESPFVDNDGYIYLFSAIDKGGLQGATRVARVNLATVTNRDTYVYWGGFDWVTNEQQAKEIYFSGKYTSVNYNSHTKSYLAVYNRLLSNTVVLRSSKKINESWRTEVPLFSGVKPFIFSITDVRQHKAYETENGKNILISYTSAIDTNKSDVYLVQYSFYRD